MSFPRRAELWSCGDLLGPTLQGAVLASLLPHCLHPLAEMALPEKNTFAEVGADTFTCLYLRPFIADSPGTKQALHCTKLLNPRSKLLLLSKASSRLKVMWPYSSLLLQTTGFIHSAQIKGLTQPISLRCICFAYTHSRSFSLLRRIFPKSQRNYVLCQHMHVTSALYSPSVSPAMQLPHVRVPKQQISEP